VTEKAVEFGFGFSLMRLSRVQPLSKQPVPFTGEFACALGNSVSTRDRNGEVPLGSKGGRVGTVASPRWGAFIAGLSGHDVFLD
jgi:hypothetical protein